jgi:hypothetical protein
MKIQGKKRKFSTNKAEVSRLNRLQITIFAILHLTVVCIPVLMHCFEGQAKKINLYSSNRRVYAPHIGMESILKGCFSFRL